MPDTFDPDAWPNPGGSQRPSPNNRDAVPSHDEDEDDYDPLAFEPEPVSTGRQPSDRDPFSYDDFDDDLGTTGSTSRSPATQPTPNEFDHLYDDDTSITAGRPSEGGSYNDDYSDQYDDEDYDNFDDLNREPKQRGGLAKILVMLAVVAVIGIIGVFAYQLATGGDSEQGATDTTTDVVGTSEPAPAEVFTAADEALVAWGKFAVTGDLELVKPYFQNDGKQYDQFQVDAEAILDNPPGGAPLTFALDHGSAKTYRVTDNDWMIRGNVTQSRTGEKTLEYSWEIRVIRESESDPWRVFTVRQY